MCFDPGTLMLASTAATVIGGGLTAASTIAGGSAAAEAGKMASISANREAQQIESNAAGELAAGQRTAAETRLKVNLARSAALARGAASGFNAAEGSLLTNDEDLASRGELAALTDVFNGENARTGLLNKAESVRYGGRVAAYEGEAKRNASYLAAAGTIAGTAGSAFKNYGEYKFPRARNSSYG